MTEQTKAQRLAECITTMPGDSGFCDQAAAELRRLDANEAALLEALKDCVDDSEEGVALHVQNYGETYKRHRLAAMRAAVTTARALIARIEAERNAK